MIDLMDQYPEESKKLIDDALGEYASDVIELLRDAGNTAKMHGAANYARGIDAARHIVERFEIAGRQLDDVSLKVTRGEW